MEWERAWVPLKELEYSNWHSGVKDLRLGVAIVELVLGRSGGVAKDLDAGQHDESHLITNLTQLLLGLSRALAIT
jgi:hypothetical protein